LNPRDEPSLATPGLLYFDPEEEEFEEERHAITDAVFLPGGVTRKTE
jgi:hypothetical protein